MININNKQDCCGCSAYAQRCPKQCISMIEDEEWFLYPKVDTANCIDCHLCEKVCPVINQDEPRTPQNVYAVKNPNETIRMNSSSGGIFTILAEQIINSEGVVFGACWDDEWNIKHDYAECIDDLAKFRSSKYLQSVIGDTYIKAEQFLKTGRKVMFTGTPCQIAGLKHFLRKEYDNLLAVEIICHSVPSPGVWQQYLAEKLQSQRWNKSDIRHISFRSKATGWKGYSFMIENKDGNVFSELGSKNAFMRGFLANLYTRPSCKKCPAKQLKSGSDITLGDFWGINSLMPEIDDDKGVSVVIVNTEKGREAMHIVDNLFPASWTDICSKNPAVVKSATVSAKKDQFFQEDGLSFENKIHILCKPPFSMRHKVGNILRRLHII